MNAKRIHEVINKWRIDKALLASKMGMLKGTFFNKLNPNHKAKFSRDELKELNRILSNLANELRGRKAVDPVLHWWNVLGYRKRPSYQQWESGQVKATYRTLSKKLHPDVGGSTIEFQHLNNAYQKAKSFFT